MVDPERGIRRPEVRERRERHRRAIIRAHIDALEGVGAIGKLRSNFHDHVILVQRPVHDRDLALAKGIVESAINRGCGDSKTCGRVAVNHNTRLQSLVLLVGVDVTQLRQRTELLKQPRRPVVHLCQVLSLQRVLELGLAHAPADGQILCRLHVEGRTRDDR